jgi:hypothetical protein
VTITTGDKVQIIGTVAVVGMVGGYCLWHAREMRRRTDLLASPPDEPEPITQEEGMPAWSPDQNGGGPPFTSHAAAGSEESEPFTESAVPGDSALPADPIGSSENG